MNRRRLMALIGGAAAGALPCPSPHAGAAHAAERMRRIGILAPLTKPRGRSRVAAFRERLAQLGWTEGRDIQIDVRWSADDKELAGQHARELVAAGADVIVMQSLQGLRALRQGTRAVPVVIGAAADLVEMGIVNSLAHPGGNITGFTFAEFSIGAKWLELLKTIAPHLARVLNLHHSGFARFLPTIEASAASFAVQPVAAPVRDAAEMADAIDAFAREPDGAIIVHPDPVMGAHTGLLIALAARHGLPAIYPYRGFVLAGGLMCYGLDWIERWRSMAGYVDLILRGAQPADLPVQSATKIEFVINLRTAKALGLAVPARLLAGADDIIQ